MSALVAPLHEHRSLVDLAYDALLQGIFDQTLKPSERLRIDPLARAFGVSITPVREALVRATAERLVIQTSNRGFAVAPLLTRAEYQDLFATRLVLETTAVRCIGEVDEGSLGELERSAGLISRPPSGPRYAEFDRFGAADSQFHRRLVALSSNRFLVIAWENLHAHLHVSRLYAGADVSNFDEAEREHRAIVSALRERDIPAAAEVTADHIHSSERRLRHLLPKGETP